MRRLLIVGLILCFALVLPASAYQSVGAWGSSGQVYAGDTIIIGSPATICAMNGQSVYRGVPNPYRSIGQRIRSSLTDGSGAPGSTYSYTDYSNISSDDFTIVQTVPNVAPGETTWFFEIAACGGGGNPYIGRYWNYTQYRTIEATFNATPSSGYIAPQTITFVGSALYQNADTKEWAVGYADGTGIFRTSTGVSSITQTFSLPDEYVVNFTVTNGTTTYTTSLPITIQSSSQITQYFQNIDGQTGGAIHNSDISMKDDTTGQWTNVTSDADGTASIIINGSHTVSGYGSATGYQSVSRTGLTPFGGIYELIMWPSSMLPAPGSGSPGDPGIGNVNLIVIVNDRATSQPLSGAQVSTTAPSGAVTGQATGESGSVTFVVPNSSVIRIAVSKTGYTSASKTITTTANGPDTARVELDKKVVTASPTSTIPPGGVTTAVTLDSRTGSQKEQAIMDILIDNGEAIVEICVLVIVLGLLGIKLGG